MQTHTSKARRMARRARVAKTETPAPEPPAAAELWGITVAKAAAPDLLAGEVKAIAKTTDLDLTHKGVLVLTEGRAVGEVELGDRVDARTWVVKSAKAYDRPKATDVPEGAEGVIQGVRVLERRKATLVDEPVTKAGAATYNPSRVADHVLLADVRVLAQWGEDVAVQKAAAEIERRGLQLERPEPVALSLDTELDTLATVDLVAAHQAIHVAKGWTPEDAASLHAQVVVELADRGVPHPEPPLSLDQRSAAFEPSRWDVAKSAGELALVEAVAGVEQYPVLVHKRIEGRAVTVAKSGDRVKVVAEDGADVTAEVPEVVAAVAKLEAEALELEGALEPWHGGQVLQVQDLGFDGRDLRDWPVAKRLERLAELGIEQATGAAPSLLTPINEVPAVEAGDPDTLERVIRTTKGLPGAAGVVIKPVASVDPGEWVELEAAQVAKVEDPGPLPFIRRGSQILIGTPGGRRVERWEYATELLGDAQIVKRLGAMPWGALSGEATERGEVELGAQKPWLREYFLRGEREACRLLVRKAVHGEIEKAQHSYRQCMTCRAAPEVDVLWADGRARGWFCKGCYPKWTKKNGGAKALEVIGTKAIIGGRAPTKFADRHNRVEVGKAAGPQPFDGGWIAVETTAAMPLVLTEDAVSKRWIPPLGVSALPRVVADQVPPNLAYWQSGSLAQARDLRDQLVAKIDAGEVILDITKAYEPGVSGVSQIDTTEEADLVVPIVKIDSDRQIVTGIVLEPGEVDAQNDTITAEVIERASIGFLSRYNSETQLGIMHRVFGDVGLQLAASWVALHNHTLGAKKVKRGSWLMSMKVIDPKLWGRVKKGEFTGFSVGGVARVRNGDQGTAKASA